MNRITLLILLSFLILSTSPLSAESFTGKCAGISDADTITVLNGKAQVKVRLEGIDAPELHQDFGKRGLWSMPKPVPHWDYRHGGGRK